MMRKRIPNRRAENHERQEYSIVIIIHSSIPSFICSISTITVFESRPIQDITWWRQRHVVCERAFTREQRNTQNEKDGTHFGNRLFIPVDYLYNRIARVRSAVCANSGVIWFHVIQYSAAPFIRPQHAISATYIVLCYICVTSPSRHGISRHVTRRLDRYWHHNELSEYET